MRVILQIAETALRVVARAPCKWLDGRERTPADCTQASPCMVHEILAKLPPRIDVALPGQVGQVNATIGFAAPEGTVPR